MIEQDPAVLERELRYHEKLYSGFAQSHFAKAGVRAFRANSVQRILQLTGAGQQSKVLSLGCGIGDTELLLAPHVGHLTGIDLSPSAIRQANQDAARLGITNAEFIEGTLDAVSGQFDVIIAIFFLHHLSDAALAALPRHLLSLLRSGGVVYTLDPNVRRLAGVVGRWLAPSLMKRYQTDDERELEPEFTQRLFATAGFRARSDIYDFGSAAVAGLFPAWRGGYALSRSLDDVLLRSHFLKRMGSNFEIIATKP